MWADHVALFAQRYRVISYDIRGHGQSIMLPIPYANHRDVRDLLRALGADTAYVLGHSMGGGIALNATLLYPEMVDALILVGDRRLRVLGDGQRACGGDGGRAPTRGCG
jgi:pimeloyl-ACP methyl ester carboxylesterase